LGANILLDRKAWLTFKTILVSYSTNLS